jgi:predicted GNAT superfamily acetyltransferase
MTYPKKIFIQTIQEERNSYNLPLFAWFSEKPEDFAKVGEIVRVAVFELTKIMEVSSTTSIKETT